MLEKLIIEIVPGGSPPVRLKDQPATPKPRQSGQSLVEYLVIVALVAVGGIGIMRTVGQSVNVGFARVAKSLGAESEGRISSARVAAGEYKKRTLRNFMNGSDGNSHNSDQPSTTTEADN